jgi:hypothetical protein
VSAAAVMATCGNAVPATDDVPDLMAEAAGTKPPPKWGDSPVRKAVRSSFRTMLYFDSLHEAEVRARFQRPELRSYLFLSDSYIGGDFPRRTAMLLREVQQANRDYLQRVQTFSSVLNERMARTDLSAGERSAIERDIAAAYAARQQPAVQVVTALDGFVDSAAQLYELMAVHSGSIQSMRTGLEIADPRVLQRYNGLVDQVNRAHEAADSAMRRLVEPDQQQRFRRMGLTKRVNQTS